MTILEAEDYVSQKTPQVLHLSGKTSTGKTTFAKAISKKYGYQIIELDSVLRKSVISPLAIEDEGKVFLEVYKSRSRLDWITLFIDSVSRLISQSLMEGNRVVIDGAIASTDTLSDLFRPYIGIEILYFHPIDVDHYVQLLTNRFMLSGPRENAGLPVNFWNLMQDTELVEYWKSGKITHSISLSIQQYAEVSHNSSKDRFRKLKRAFPQTQLVEI